MPLFSQETGTPIALVALLILGAAGICSAVCDIWDKVSVIGRKRA